MTTEIYGASDDLIEFDGDFRGEYCNCNSSEKSPILLILSDGTKLEIYYSKNGVWKINIKANGPLFDSIRIETDRDATRYSDTVVMKDGIEWAAIDVGGKSRSIK
jgi:hypothetical protein